MNRRFIVPGVGASTPVAEAAPALLLSKAEPLFALEVAARSGADVDAVHDMRVASRRLREAMRLLAPLYRRREFDAWYKRVRRITRALGPVRDSDVFIEDFSRLGRELAGGGKRAVAFMVGYRMGQREHELEALNRELAGLDLDRSRRSFEKLARSVSTSQAAAGSLAAFAHAAIAERAAVVFGAQPLALVEANVEQQHALRIDYKRLRYAVEVFAPCYNGAFDSLHAALTSFQDTLGDLHDVHVFLDTLRAPERIEAARRAGVSRDDLAEVDALLEARARAGFARFMTLSSEHPAEVLLPGLLLPLTRVSVPPPAVTVEPPENVEELAIASPVVVGDEPWTEGWDGIEPAVDALRPVDPTGDLGPPR